MDYFVAESKIVIYLLSSPRKSGFFLRFGYSAENWTQLRDDLLYIANNFSNSLRRHTPHGDEYEIVGEVQAPNSRTIRLRTGWMIRANEPGIMSFITAYPAQSSTV
jgi:hypothetical protein